MCWGKFHPIKMNTHAITLISLVQAGVVLGNEAVWNRLSDSSNDLVSRLLGMNNWFKTRLISIVSSQNPLFLYRVLACI